MNLKIWSSNDQKKNLASFAGFYGKHIFPDCDLIGGLLLPPHGRTMAWRRVACINLVRTNETFLQSLGSTKRLKGYVREIAKIVGR